MSDLLCSFCGRDDGAAVLCPGFGGTAKQPLLVKLGRALSNVGIASKAITFSTRRPSAGYAKEKDDVRRARDVLAKKHDRIALIGRSYGGRICTFVAAEEPPHALIVLGYPIRPPNRPRPDDEAALREIACPTLIIHGAHDELGPLDILRSVTRNNRHIELHVLENTGHSFGRQEKPAIVIACSWLRKLPR